MKILLWGTYDKSKPRLRIFLEGLRIADVDVHECHFSIWEKFEDKSQISNKFSRLVILFRIVIAYPMLLARLVFTAKPDVILVAYPALLDIFIVAVFAKVRGIPIVWDVFISLYNTIVEDRQLLNTKSVLSKLLFHLEQLAFKIADVIILDTQSHGLYLAEKYDIDHSKVKSVYVGAEVDMFERDVVTKKHTPTRILFYGQFIPLHGIEKIIDAALIASESDFFWTLIGKGQESEMIKKKLENFPLPNLIWIPWVNYNELRGHINRSDICLGIFGDTIKAKLVIPNKVFQIISTGKPLVTMDSPAIRELFPSEIPGIEFPKDTNAAELVEAIHRLIRKYDSLPNALFSEQKKQISPTAIGKKYKELLCNVLDGCE